MAYLPITDHGLIGDLHTAGLVGSNGRMVWLPWPRFDSPSIFAAILDDEHGGDWLMAPLHVARSKQSYDGETAVLLTEFEAAGGRAALRDWMSPWDGEAPGHDLCRVLCCIEGEIEVFCRFAPRPNYARNRPSLEMSEGGLSFEADGVQIYLECNHEWSISEDQATLRTTLRQGEEIRCVLSSGTRVPLSAIEEDLYQTRAFWREWIGKCTYNGPWHEAVRRSAITLKLLTYAPTGAIIAAPTTSLPEWIGGIRNWDYRYTWLRDSSLTLYALHLLGYKQEARAFFSWLRERSQEHGAPLRIMYGVRGETNLEEFELPHLEGYRCSRPVRIGNAAYRQSQLDVYGGVIDAAFLYEKQGDLLDPVHWNALRREIDYVCSHWDQPDHGIWEMRGPQEHHTFSKIMCWVAVDRGVRLVEHEGWPGDLERWTKTRKAIRESILKHAWNKEIGSFTQTYNSDLVDASLLMIPAVGFLPAHDPRVRSTIERIKERLASGALVYRYRSNDYLPDDEGAFLLCSFWMVDALIACDRIEEARERFEELLRCSSAHGLLSEEVDPQTGMALGNYPQAFSHIGLINSALNLSRAITQPDEPPAPGTRDQESEEDM
ncbi:MAG: glycosyl hydrolase [Herpetosiphonaceae bacterium]|nr:MAG: glycosyl hydrolase [Herpetosiphonaceae bacterium]